jgi:phosphotransferase system enzyme I (PtsP)
MVPMVTVSAEVDAARAMVDREMAWVRARGGSGPSSIRIGAMVEVPATLFDLDGVMKRSDFVSVGSNDLLQFLMAADRGNPRVANRYDALSLPALRALRSIVDAGNRLGVPVTLCGELGGRPLECMVLIGLGFRSVSMSPASVGPIKAMIRSLDASRVAGRLDELMASGATSIRDEMKALAESDSVEL